MFGRVNTVINYGPDSSNKIPTYYFRTTFEVEDLSKIGDMVTLTLELMIVSFFT